ncbi:ZMAT4 protein, partial [Polypterus senegalus]
MSVCLCPGHVPQWRSRLDAPSGARRGPASEKHFSVDGLAQQRTPHTRRGSGACTTPRERFTPQTAAGPQYGHVPRVRRKETGRCQSAAGSESCAVAKAGQAGSATQKATPRQWPRNEVIREGNEDGDVDKNKCCTLCNMSFTSAVVAESHYQGKIHAKRLKLLLGEQPERNNKEVLPNPVKSASEPSALMSPRQRRDSDRYCQLCNAWFNNPGMAQQHYEGKKHKKNAARADLLEQLSKTLDLGGLKVASFSGCHSGSSFSILLSLHHSEQLNRKRIIGIQHKAHTASAMLPI